MARTDSDKKRDPLRGWEMKEKGDEEWSLTILFKSMASVN
jgi:hypothetical protein